MGDNANVHRFLGRLRSIRNHKSVIQLSRGGEAENPFEDPQRSAAKMAYDQHFHDKSNESDFRSAEPVELASNHKLRLNRPLPTTRISSIASISEIEENTPIWEDKRSSAHEVSRANTPAMRSPRNDLAELPPSRVSALVFSPVDFVF